MGVEVNQLAKKLEQLIGIMSKIGLLPELAPGAKKNMAEEIANKLSNDKSVDINSSALENNNEVLFKKLAATCMIHLQQKNNPAYKFDYTILFKKEEDVPEKKLKEELHSLLKVLLKLTPAYQAADDTKQKQLDDKLENEAGNLAKKMKRESLADLVAGLTDTLSDQRRTLYGVDTQRPGEEPKAVLGVPFGNMMNFQDLADDPNDLSFASKSNEANSRVADPLGVRFKSILESLDTSSSLVNELDAIDLLPASPEEANAEESKSHMHSPFNNKLKPKGPGITG